MNVAYFPLKGIKLLASAGCVTALFFSASISAQTTSGNSAAGQDLFGNFHITNNPTGKGCVSCHSVTSASRANAANAGAHITYANGQGMGGAALTVAQRDDIAAYIAANNTTTLATQTVSFQGSKAVVAPGFSLGTSLGDYIGLRTANNSTTRGTVSYSGTTITYNALTGQCGTDTFSYEAYRSGAAVQGTGTSNERTVTFDITDPAAPIINSAISKTSTVGISTTYTITTTGGTPLSWGHTSIPTNLTRTNNVISGTPTVAGTFNSTVSAFNCFSGNLAGQSDSQAVTWTVGRGTQAALTARINALSGSQIFTFSNPNGTATLSTVGGSGIGAVTYSSSNTAVCTVTATTTLNLVGAGTCTITATKAQDANYFLTTDTIGVTVNPAAQTLSFGAQTTPRTFVQGGTFLVSPTATNTSTSISGIAITYDSNTPAVCTLPGTTSTTVTMVAAGACTIGANLAGNTNYAAATEQTQTVTINPILPQPPTIGAGVGGNAQAVINFTPPTNTGGTAILDYTATCTASGQTTLTATVASSPATVLSMVNGVVYSCSVKSRNSVGSSTAASASVNVTPTSSPVITSLNNTTFTITSNGAFNIIATGVPTPTITMTGTPPAGVTFTGGVGAATLTGIPAAGTAGATTQNYPLTFTATNAGGSVMQSFTLTVQKASQTTTFGALAGRPMRPVPATLTATASSGLPITFSIDPGTTANCSVSGNLLFTNNIGACGVRASQAGNTSYYAAQTILQGFNITQGTQTIVFGSQGAQSYSPSSIFGLDPKALSVDPIDLLTDTGLAVAYASLTPGVCSISGAFVTIVSAGTCTIEVTQAGDANYAAATPVTQDIAINMASQTITWGAQSSQSFGTGGTFAINPLANGGASGNAIAYDTSTPGVCTVSGTTVTKVSSGICTLTANQVGDGNYAAASQVARTLTISASVPTAPTATLITMSDSQIVIEFNPPGSDGGSAITIYRATCNPGGIFAQSAASPITVTGLNNNTEYTCSVRAQNAAGNSPPSNGLIATPFLETGVNLWANVCSGCHGALPAGVRFNAAGTTGTVLNYVRSIQPAMLVSTAVQAFTLNELAEIEKYIATFVPAIGTTTAFNTPVMVDVSSHLTLGTVSFTTAAVVTPPTNGSLSAFSATQITYTPTAGFVGVDTFTYRGTHSGPTVNGDPRTVTITVNPPPIPVITSPAIAAGMFNAPFAYQITATNSPTSFGAAPLGVNFSINASGLVSGTPMVTGTFTVTISATNAGGTGMQSVDITISKASQTITFGAQGGQAFSPGGTFPLSPVATASSALAVSYSSLTPSVCTISTTTVTMLTAGTCTIAADQSGNGNYEAALQVSRSIIISATVPGAPTIGTATPGDTVAAIGFTPPSNNGGSVITGYIASCTPGLPFVGNGTASPVTVSGLTNDTLYTCAVRATNAAGNSALSGTVMVTPTGTPVAPQISSANATTFTVGAPSTFTVTATGTPAPTLALVGALPTGVTFAPLTGALAGTPALGQVNSYPLTIAATGTAPAAMQSFTLTVQTADQTISFTGPASQPFTASTIPLTASASSTLPVTLASNTPSVCTISVTTLTLLTVGTCSITASQAGDANYNAATSVTQGFSVTQATQTITFNAQVPANRSFVAGSTFAVNPLASASSNLAVIYSSTTPGICSVVGINVTILAPGICTIAANQSGSANFLAATQVTQNVSFSTTVPGAPTIGTASGGNAQATINFTAPANNGGSTIIDYTATCNVGGFSAVGSASPIIVSGLANNTAYLCSVTARNSVGSSVASATVSVTPLSGQGSALWTQVCDVCHTAVPAGNQLNGAGSSATVLNYVRANQNAMIFNAGVQALSASDLADIATYIASVIQPNDAATTINTPVMVNVNNHITITNQVWSAFTNIEIVTSPTNGTLGSFTGTQIQYTPTTNFTGTDSFTYRGKRIGGISYDGDPQTVTINVNPSPPAITSALSASGIFGQAFGYLITATNTPTSFDATPLPAGLSVSAAGLISGSPGVSGQFSIAISATNGGGSGEATLTLQIDPVPQLITFGAQPSPRTFAANGIFAILPVATGGGSGNPIMYSTNTPSVCTVSVTTVTIVAAGICTITADQAGGTNFAAAVQATQNVTISPVAPSAPGILSGTPGNTQATIAFTPSTSTGGSPITNYTATCGAMSATGAGSPIVVAGLTNGVQVMCSVTATGPGGTSAASGNVNVTPATITVPGAPTIDAITPGDGQASITFSAPASDGGSAITSYTSTCLPGGIINNGTVSPLVVTGLTNGQTYTCFLAATNVAGPGPNSAGVDVTPQSSLVFTGVVSRKTHGAAGSFSVPINPLTIPTGLVDVEPRVIGAGHTLVFSFNNPITAAGAVSTTAGSAVAVASGNDVVVTLTAVPDNSRVTVTLTNVNSVPTPFAASMGFLIGDVNTTRSVTASDISGVKARSGQTTTSLNFRFDVNATGAISASDISAVKARSGLTLPP